MNGCWRRWKRYNDVAPAHNPPYVRGDAAAGQGTAGDSAGGGVRDRLSRNDRAGAEALCGAAGMGREAWHQALRLPRGQPSLHRASGPRNCCDNPEAKIISCHLGGSSSLCAIQAGKSVATSMGMSPQSGLPQNNRVGDFDPFALPCIDAGHRQDAGASAGRSGQSFGPAGPERQQRSARHRGSSGKAANAQAQLGTRRLCRQRCAITSVRICCC